MRSTPPAIALMDNIFVSLKKNPASSKMEEGCEAHLKAHRRGEAFEASMWCRSNKSPGAVWDSDAQSLIHRR